MEMDGATHADIDTGMSAEAGNGETKQQIGPVAPGGDGDSHQVSQGYGGVSNKGNEDKKIFVGGLSYDTTGEDLTEFFSKFGEVTGAIVKYDPFSGRSRGFAFVEFSAPDPVVEILKARTMEIKGKTVEVKPAKSRENKKIFVGGLPNDFPEEDLKKHFEQFGKVDEIEWPWDKMRNVRRNFAFVVFEEEAGADAASSQNKQSFGDRECDVKKAVPQRGGRGGLVGGGMMGRGGGGRGGRGRGYGQYGGGQWGGGYGGYGQGYGGGWGDWYGQQGYGNYYGSGYGYGYDYSGGNQDYSGYGYGGSGWNNWGQSSGDGQGGQGGGYEGYGQGHGGGQGGRGGRYQPY